METDADSHRPLMSDDEEEVEVFDKHCQTIQQADEPVFESPQPISFIQAFCLPGVLPVSLRLQHKAKNKIRNCSHFTTRGGQAPHLLTVSSLVSVCTAVFFGVRMSEAGQLLLLLLASFLPEQQLRLEGGGGRPSVCVVRCGRNRRFVESLLHNTIQFNITVSCLVLGEMSPNLFHFYRTVSVRTHETF